MDYTIVRLVEKLLKEMRSAKVNKPKTPAGAIPPEIRREVKRLQNDNIELGYADEEMVQLLASVSIFWKKTVVPASRKTTTEWYNEFNFHTLWTATPQTFQTTLRRVREKKENAEKLKALNKLIIHQAFLRTLSKDLTSGTFNMHAYKMIRSKATKNIQELDQIIFKLDAIIRTIEDLEKSKLDAGKSGRPGRRAGSSQASDGTAAPQVKQPGGSAAVGAKAAEKAGPQTDGGFYNHQL